MNIVNEKAKALKLRTRLSFSTVDLHSCLWGRYSPGLLHRLADFLSIMFRCEGAFKFDVVSGRKPEDSIKKLAFDNNL